MLWKRHSIEFTRPADIVSHQMMRQQRGPMGDFDHNSSLDPYFRHSSFMMDIAPLLYPPPKIAFLIVSRMLI